MGKWELLSMKTSTSAMDNPQFGTDIKVTFRLKYKPSKLGKYVEMPLLEWNETIVLVYHNDPSKAKKYWVFNGNVYLRKPSVKTLESWLFRYVHAYDFVCQNLGKPPRGYVKNIIGFPKH